MKVYIVYLIHKHNPNHNVIDKVYTNRDDAEIRANRLMLSLPAVMGTEQGYYISVIKKTVKGEC